jgi:hypothetical protein
LHLLSDASLLEGQCDVNALAFQVKHVGARINDFSLGSIEDADETRREGEGSF